LVSRTPRHFKVAGALNRSRYFFHSMIARKSPEAALSVNCLSIATLAGINFHLPFSIVGTNVSPASKKSFLSCSTEILLGILRGRPRGFPHVPGSNCPSLLRGIVKLLDHSGGSWGVEAARLAGLTALPVLRITHLTAAQKVGFGAGRQ
jgi:hypothetical protein